MRDEKTLSRILGVLAEPGWEDLTKVAKEKLRGNEDSVSRKIFRTRVDIDLREIEYYRGFRQGVMYMLDGLPHQLRAEYERARKESDS